MPSADEPGAQADEAPDWLFEGAPDAPPARAVAPAAPPLRWPGWVQLGLTVITAFLVVWAAAVPGGAVGPALFSYLFGLLAALWWLGWVGAASIDLVRHRAVRPPRSLLARWLLAPALVGIVALLVWQHVPVRTTFALSRGSFDAILAEPRPLEPPDDYFAEPRDLGLYTGYVRYKGSATLVDVAFLGGAGFVHLGGPPPDGIQLGVPLGDGWYTFERASLYGD